MNDGDEALSVASNARNDMSLRDWTPHTERDAHARALGVQPIEAAEHGEPVDFAAMRGRIIVDESEHVPPGAMGIDVFDELNGLATVATCTVHDDRLDAVAK